MCLYEQDYDMGQISSVTGHLVDVSAILLLGIVYVFVLAIGSVASLMIEEFKRVGSIGTALRQRVWDKSGPAP